MKKNRFKKYLPKKPYIIGLTGGIGSGKSLAGKLFQKLDIAVFDADQVVRDIFNQRSDVKKKIIQKFGKKILDSSGYINRKKFRTIVFTSEKMRKWLEKLLHPLVIKKLKKVSKCATSPYCILIIPLLFEAKLENFVHRILVLDTTVKLQIERTRKRSGLTYKEIRAILKIQTSRKKRRQKADDLIENIGTKLELVKAIKKIHQLYLTLAEKNI